MTHINSQACRLYIVRHGESEYNLAEKVAGYFNTKLTQKGKEQAKQAKKILGKITFDDVYSSDLSRAAETASILFGSPVPKSHQLAGLRERYYGVLEEKPDFHLDGWHGEMIALGYEDRWHYRHAQDMESDAELIKRFLNSVEEIAKQNTGKTILIVAHGGCIRAMLVKLGFANHEDLPPKSFKNAGYVELTYDDHGLTVEQVEGIDHKLVERTKEKLL